MRTDPSMTTWGPTWTASPRSASGSISAVGWTRAECAIGMAAPLTGAIRPGTSPVPSQAVAPVVVLARATFRGSASVLLYTHRPHGEARAVSFGEMGER